MSTNVYSTFFVMTGHCNNPCNLSAPPFTTELVNTVANCSGINSNNRSFDNRRSTAAWSGGYLRERKRDTQRHKKTETQKNRKQRKRPKKGVVLDTDQITLAVADSSLTPPLLPPIPHWATTTPSTIQRCNRLCPPRKLSNIRNKYRRKKGQKFKRSIPTMYRPKCTETMYGNNV